MTIPSDDYTIEAQLRQIATARTFYAMAYEDGEWVLRRCDVTPTPEGDDRVVETIVARYAEPLDANEQRSATAEYRVDVSGGRITVSVWRGRQLVMQVDGSSYDDVQHKLKRYDGTEGLVMRDERGHRVVQTAGCPCSADGLHRTDEESSTPNACTLCHEELA